MEKVSIEVAIVFGVGFIIGTAFGFWVLAIIGMQANQRDEAKAERMAQGTAPAIGWVVRVSDPDHPRHGQRGRVMGISRGKMLLAFGEFGTAHGSDYFTRGQVRIDWGMADQQPQP